MPVLYSILLHSECSANGLGPTDLSAVALKFTKAVFKMLTAIAKMNPETFQVWWNVQLTNYNHIFNLYA